MKQFLFNKYYNIKGKYRLVESVLRGTSLDIDSLIDHFSHDEKGMCIEGLEVNGYNYNNEFYIIEAFHLHPQQSLPSSKAVKEVPVDYSKIPQIDYIIYSKNSHYTEESNSEIIDINQITKNNHFIIQEVKSEYNFGASDFYEIIIWGIMGAGADVIWEKVKTFFAQKIDLIDIREELSRKLNIPIKEILFCEIKDEYKDTKKLIFKTPKYKIAVTIIPPSKILNIETYFGR